MDLARGAIARHRDVVVGVKARLSADVVGTNDLEALRRAQEAAAPFNLPVMIHMGQSVSPMRAILALLKRGDIVTHMFAPPPSAIIDDKGACFRRCWRRAAAASGSTSPTGAIDHIRWDVADRVIQQGFWPDTISTDWNTQSRTSGVIDFPNVMSKFLMLGMPLDKVIAAATVNAARVFETFNDRGTLNVGAPADVAVLELREGTFEFLDNYKGKRIGRQRLFPIANGDRRQTRSGPRVRRSGARNSRASPASSAHLNAGYSLPAARKRCSNLRGGLRLRLILLRQKTTAVITMPSPACGRGQRRLIREEKWERVASQNAFDDAALSHHALLNV